MRLNDFLLLVVNFWSKAMGWEAADALPPVSAALRLREWCGDGAEFDSSLGIHRVP